jgi:hypothetical protein
MKIDISNFRHITIAICRTYVKRSSADRSMIVIDPIPQYINGRKSDLRGVKEGWYAFDEQGSLVFGPFFNQETCLRRINQSEKWSNAFWTRRPLS